ncbi:MAG: GNAT family N-acetyltransferase [Thalassotalea sp.]
MKLTQNFERPLENSLCFGLYTQNGQQVGFARMITDKATFAYLSDVFIAPAHQGQGLGKLLLAFIFNHDQLQGLRRIMLATQDAHHLYQQFGFAQLHEAQMFMETRDFTGY